MTDTDLVAGLRDHAKAARAVADSSVVPDGTTRAGWRELASDISIAADRLEALSKPHADARVERPKLFLAWAVRTFGEVAKDPVERACRFGEEAIELLHASGLERDRVEKLIERVYSRPPGNMRVEVGQAQACLETLAEVEGWNAHDEAGREFNRVQRIPQEEWDRRHKAKIEIGIARASMKGEK